MFVSCPAARFHALCVSMCMPTCTRYVRDVYAAARALALFHSQGSAALPRTVCMRQRGHFHSSTLEAARRHLGMSVFRRRRSAGLQRVRVCWGSRSSRAVSLGRPVSAVLRSCGAVVLWSCGPAGVFCAVMLSAMHAARPGTTYVCRCASRCVSRCHARGGAGGLAMEAWRWRLGAGGLALEASWPVAMRRRALGAVPPVLVTLGGVARRGMWRGECRLWVPRA